MNLPCSSFNSITRGFIAYALFQAKLIISPNLVDYETILGLFINLSYLDSSIFIEKRLFNHLSKFHNTTINLR